MRTPSVLSMPLGGAADWMGIRPVMGMLALFALFVGVAGAYQRQRGGENERTS